MNFLMSVTSSFLWRKAAQTSVASVYTFAKMLSWNHTIQLQSVPVFTVKHRKVRDLFKPVGGERVKNVLVKVVPSYIPAGPVDQDLLVQILVTVSVIDRGD